MPRHVRDAKLSSREARSRLKVQGKPHWRLIEPGLHLGYRRLAGKPGTWVVRRYVGQQTYTVETIKGTVADDYGEADGKTILSFIQAQKEALKHKPKAGPLTVQQAIEEYLRHLEARSNIYDAGRRAQAFIFPQLGSEKVEGLTTKRLRKWHNDLANTPRRRRRSSANRVLATLKAALNHAWREGHVATDIEWRRVRSFPGTVAARARYLTVQEARRLINASGGQFRRLVEAALATGCRYSELARLTVSDFNPDAGTLHIRKSKSGKPRHVVLVDEGMALFRHLAAARAGNELFFRAPRGGPWLASCQERPMRLACGRARIIPPVGFHALRHTWASHAVMNGVPLLVVAKNLGHADTRMVEKHYGHLAPSYIADAIRAGAPRFGMVESSGLRVLR